MIPFETIDMSKYQTAMQHPKTAFADPDLVEKRVAKNSLGWPAAQSGSYAIVYRLIGRNRITSKEEVVAVRCFKKLAPDLAHRYELISSTLDSAAPRSKYLLRTRYLAEGVKIDGSWKPVTTLPWVDGVSFDRHFDSAYDKPWMMERTLAQVRDIARDLEAAGIAHCDLQHRNIVVDGSGTLRLIDYDGMFVPTLKGNRTNELGHPDFQHPGRDDGGIFGPTLDRFALISIYLQTYAVGRHPELWRAKERTEGLLLRKQDYLDPDGSATIAALRQFDDLREMVDLFRRLCVGDLGDVPSLGTFLRDVGLDDRVVAPAVPTPPPSTPVPPMKAPSPAPAPGNEPPAPGPRPSPTLYMTVIPAEQDPLAANAGDEVMVVGRYESSARRRDADGRPATSLFLQMRGRGTFSVLVEGPTVKQFAALGQRWTIRKGGWLAVTGLLVRGNDDFIIQVDQMAQLERIDEQEAHRRMNMRRWSTPSGAGQGDGRTAGPHAVPRPAPRRSPTSPPTPRVVRQQPSAAEPSVETRGGQLVFKTFEQLGRLFGREGKGKQ